VRKQKDTYKTVKYAQIMGYTCMNPDCQSGWSIEGHHIKPIAKGGKDEYRNIIILCFDCHRKTKIHSKWRIKQIDLLMAIFYAIIPLTYGTIYFNISICFYILLVLLYGHLSHYSWLPWGCIYQP
jgi:hypothetical protein